MKKFNLLMFLLLLATSISAQTFDLGQGRKATLDQVGNYRLTWNQKSQNGGSVSGTFSGKLKDGKRDGIWRGSFTYQLFSSNEETFSSGTINFTRTYSNGVPNGAYSYNSTLKVCSGSYNYLSKQWKYSPFESYAEQIIGSFKNGYADGKWYAYQQQPYEKITMQFDNGKAVGTWTIVEKTSQTLGFRNGYLVQQKEMLPEGWGTELFYAADEKIEELPNQKTVNVSDFLAYGDYYMKGADFDKWWYLYPENSSNEDYTAYYILADYDNHVTLIGNVPEWKLRMEGKDEESLKRKAEEKEAQIFYDKYAPNFEEFKKKDEKHKLYTLLGYPELSVIEYWKPIAEKEPNIKSYAQRNKELLTVVCNIEQENDFNKWYSKKFNGLTTDLINNHVVNANDVELLTKVSRLILENYSENWKELLNSSLEKWKNKQIEETIQDITIDDIYTYLLKHDYVVYAQKSSGNLYYSGTPYKVIINGDLKKVTKEAITKHKKYYVSNWMTIHGTMDGFSYNDYMITNGDRNSVFEKVLPLVKDDKKLRKQLVKVGLLIE